MIGVPLLFRTSLGNTASSVQAITSSSTRAWAIFIASKTRGIHKIWLNFTAVSGSGTVDVRVETVNATTGLPTGTLWGTNTNASLAVSTLNKFVSVTLTADAAVTKGDQYAIAVRYSSGTSATILWRIGSTQGSPQAGSASAGTDALSGLTPTIGVEYDDGVIEAGSFLGDIPGQADTQAYNSSTNPNERANKFTCPCNCNCVGIGWWGAWQGGINASAILSLYSGTTAIGTALLPASASYSTSRREFVCPFNVPVAMTAGGVYYVANKATGTGNIQLASSSFQSTALRDATFPGYSGATRNGAAWTDTITFEANVLYPLIDPSSIVVGGGGKILSSSIIQGMR